MNLQVKLGPKVNSEVNEFQGGQNGLWRNHLWRRLRKHKMAVVGGWMLLFLYILVIFAPVISPYGVDQVVKSHFFHKPTPIHFTDEDGLSWPYVYATHNVGWGKFEVDTSTKYPLKFLVRGKKYELFGVQANIHLVGVEKPAHLFLLGTDQYGRDLFTRLLYGGRVSLFIGFVAILLSISIGLLVGGVAGYYGGLVDHLLMRLVEVVMAIPTFYILLALAAVLPLEMSSSVRFFLITVILSFLGWAGLARVIRGIVLSVRESEFVLAAQAMGATDLRLIIKHILPATTTYVVVSATLAIPNYILMESGLSFLGLGIQEPNASWGNMLNAAQSVTKIVSFPWLLLPGAMIFVTVLSYNLLGDGLRDALDPRGMVD